MAILVPSLASFLRVCQTLQETDPCACNGLDVESLLPEAERAEAQQQAALEVLESLRAGPDALDLSEQAREELEPVTPPG